jgi:hypothetical protein
MEEKGQEENVLTYRKFPTTTSFIQPSWTPSHPLPVQLTSNRIFSSSWWREGGGCGYLKEKNRRANLSKGSLCTEYILHPHSSCIRSRIGMRREATSRKSSYSNSNEVILSCQSFLCSSVSFQRSLTETRRRLHSRHLQQGWKLVVLSGATEDYTFQRWRQLIVWSGAFTATKYDKIFSVPWGRGRRWSSKRCSFFLPFNHLTLLVAREDFIKKANCQ